MTYKIKLVMKKIFSGKKVLFDIFVNFTLKELTTQFIMPQHIFFSYKLSQVIGTLQKTFNHITYVNRYKK